MKSRTCGLVRREFARVLGDLDEAVAIARLLDFRIEEIELDEVEMLDFVGAAFDELLRRHERRHVSADAKAARVRAIGDDRHELGLDRRVDLDLHVAVVGVPVDVLDRFVGRVDAHLGRPGELAGAVDDAGLQHARTDLGAGVETRDALQEPVGVVRHVARAGDAVGEIEHAVVVAEVLVVVPQARHQEAAVRIDDFRVGAAP